MIYLAHAADWISIVFFVPVLAFLGWLAITQLRARREAGREGVEAGPEG
jgi:hypothetical protein